MLYINCKLKYINFIHVYSKSIQRMCIRMKYFSLNELTFPRSTSTSLPIITKPETRNWKKSIQMWKAPSKYIIIKYTEK